jgi:hypothetical protein
MTGLVPALKLDRYWGPDEPAARPALMLPAIEVRPPLSADPGRPTCKPLSHFLVSFALQELMSGSELLAVAIKAAGLVAFARHRLTARRPGKQSPSARSTPRGRTDRRGTCHPVPLNHSVGASRGAVMPHIPRTCQGNRAKKSTVNETCQVGVVPRGDKATGLHGSQKQRRANGTWLDASHHGGKLDLAIEDLRKAAELKPKTVFDALC